MSDKVNVLIIYTGVGTGRSWGSLCFCNLNGFESVEEMVLDFAGCIRRGIDEENGYDFRCCDKWGEIREGDSYCSNCGTKVVTETINPEEIECLIGDLITAEVADCMPQEVWQELYECGWEMLGKENYKNLNGFAIITESGELVVSRAAVDEKFEDNEHIFTTNDTPIYKK